MSSTTRGPLASFFLRLGRQVWVRAALFTAIGIVVALAAGLLGPLLPFEFGLELQKCLASLAASAPDRAEVFQDAARAALARSRRDLDRSDRRLLAAAIAEAWR